MSESCEQVLERLSPFLDGELSEGESGEVRAHVAVCPPCEAVHARLVRLETLSTTLLRGAPAVTAAEWGARWSRIDGLSLDPRIVARRERSVRRTLVRFALAAGLLVAATLTLPFFNARFGEVHENHLCFNAKPGANLAEIVEAPWTDSEDHGVWIDQSEPVVIVVERF